MVSALVRAMADAIDLIGRAQKYAVAAFDFYERFSPSSAGHHAVRQFYRASSSATSNYCAAKRGRSPAEFISKLGTCCLKLNSCGGFGVLRWAPLVEMNTRVSGG